MDSVARLVAETYRCQRRLGANVIPAPCCTIVANPAHPDVWEANHADDLTARTDKETQAVFSAMDRHLRHTPWRVIHTDCFTPDAFLARLALDFDERFVAIQMALEGDLAARGARLKLRPVVDAADFDALLRLVILNHGERQVIDGLRLPPEFSAAMVDVYRSKRDAYRFHLAIKEGVPIAYGGCAAAPNGVGMIDDLFTLPSERRRGIITGVIAAFVDQLRAKRRHTIFLGALTNDRPKHLYARLGFRPVTLTRT
ncbi:MAG TPA: GNAT family N-acetyltransferase, partial [Roseiarcus sp.]